ncbi:unnamed protein product [Phyllotreta striolata]|uniref:Uncharacterized protein n=1 Tax=Phyllotreta striolata TaxID=444603 RepID=A0A9N9XQ27_PHYSR|nr:unnamed protein product [Phyllotreta striolata]
MFEYGDSEDYNFTPTDASKLASLFGTSALQSPNETDLTYTPPKQPVTDQKDVQNDAKSPKPQSTKVLIVKVVGLWKLEEQTYKSLGKHGLGVICSADLKSQELIAYKSKDAVVLRAKINDKFIFTLQKDGFSSFNDNTARSWLVKFEANDQLEFSKKLQSYGAKVVDSNKESAVISPNTPGDKPDLLPKPQNLGVGDQESDSSEKRANILNRITKLGQQTVLRSVSTASDASDHEETAKSRKHRKPKKTPLEKHKIKEELQAQQDDKRAPLTTELAVNNLVQIPANYPLMVHQPDMSNYLLTQNMELKQILSTINTKLDIIGGPKEERDNNALVSKVKALELKSDNLQATADFYKQKYEELEIKYLELIKKDNKIDDNKDSIADLEGQISALNIQLSVANEGLNELQKQSDEYERSLIKLKEYESTIEQQKSKIAELEEFRDQNKDLIGNKEAINSLNNMVSDLNQRLKFYEDELSKSVLEKQQFNLKQEHVVYNVSNLIKMAMNNMYQGILANFNEDVSYSYYEIKNPVAEHMKGATLKLIEDISSKVFDKKSQ